MSYTTWHTYGYGLQTDCLTIKSAESLADLVKCAPEFEKWVTECFRKNEITDPTIENYLELDTDCENELAFILQKVMEEAEGIELTACDDSEGFDYLLYQPKYPWQMTDKDKGLNQEKLNAIFERYLSIITEDEIEVDFMSPENGG